MSKVETVFNLACDFCHLPAVQTHVSEVPEEVAKNVKVDYVGRGSGFDTPIVLHRVCYLEIVKALRSGRIPMPPAEKVSQGTKK